ncbi:Peroxisomal membrane protein 13 [Auxenochlorella protothecoides]|uniref:Peroxin-13 n=1 Tax=Auxenochlorella protothecoides TaxID=3075 RepID=A0A087SB32_AUXPR|nr:Peroxisomal membrane protein 13 [Auxenochlorella protothecoides]KFM22936.1 Peroxisomal membrane protein 13 [Auxenochlorella protothecoides]
MTGYGSGSMYSRPAYGGVNSGGMYGSGGAYSTTGGMYGASPYGGAGMGSYGHAGGAGGGLMHFFGRLSFLVDENAHAVHFFVSALLQLLDRAGSLYGELARFILRILGVRRAKKAGQALVAASGPGQPPLPLGAPAAPKPLPAAASAAGGAPWDSVWKKQD